MRYYILPMTPVLKELAAVTQTYLALPRLGLTDDLNYCWLTSFSYVASALRVQQNDLKSMQHATCNMPLAKCH